MRTREGMHHELLALLILNKALLGFAPFSECSGLKIKVETENLRQKYEHFVQEEADVRVAMRAKMDKFKAHRDREVKLTACLFCCDGLLMSWWGLLLLSLSLNASASTFVCTYSRFLSSCVANKPRKNCPRCDVSG